MIAKLAKERGTCLYLHGAFAFREEIQNTLEEIEAIVMNVKGSCAIFYFPIEQLQYFPKVTPVTNREEIISRFDLRGDHLEFQKDKYTLCTFEGQQRKIDTSCLVFDWYQKSICNIEKRKDYLSVSEEFSSHRLLQIERTLCTFDMIWEDETYRMKCRTMQSGLRYFDLPTSEATFEKQLEKEIEKFWKEIKMKNLFESKG